MKKCTSKVTCVICKSGITILGHMVHNDVHMYFTRCRLIPLYCVFFRYPEFRDREGHFTAFYWHLLALRLGFVIMFEVRGQPRSQGLSSFPPSRGGGKTRDLGKR